MPHGMRNTSLCAYSWVHLGANFKNQATALHATTEEPQSAAQTNAHQAASAEEHECPALNPHQSEANSNTSLLTDKLCSHRENSSTNNAQHFVQQIEYFQQQLSYGFRSVETFPDTLSQGLPP